LDNLDLIKRMLDPDGVPWFLAPEIDFKKGTSPIEYSAEEWAIINANQKMECSKIYFQGGYKSKGIFCNAGTRLFVYDWKSGRIDGCCQGFPGNVGNVFEPRFKPRSEPCGRDMCICDAHMYFGITPEMDYSGEFEELIYGHDGRAQVSGA
jgi:hypothetical protein